MPQHKLIALDADDLAVISAHIQDAAVVASDIIWRQGEKRLVVGMRRPDWEEILAGENAPHQIISALRFDRVPTSLTSSQWWVLRDSRRNRSGVSWTLLTTASTSPSLS